MLDGIDHVFLSQSVVLSLLELSVLEVHGRSPKGA